MRLHKILSTDEADELLDILEADIELMVKILHKDRPPGGAGKELEATIRRREAIAWKLMDQKPGGPSVLDT